jgi:hypothetical protein
LFVLPVCVLAVILIPTLIFLSSPILLISNKTNKIKLPIDPLQFVLIKVGGNIGKSGRMDPRVGGNLFGMNILSVSPME